VLQTDPTTIFSRQIFKGPQISNFLKIRRVGAELIHADRQTDRPDEANNCLSQSYEQEPQQTTVPSTTGQLTYEVTISVASYFSSTSGNISFGTRARVAGGQTTSSLSTARRSNKFTLL